MYRIININTFYQSVCLILMLCILRGWLSQPIHLVFFEFPFYSSPVPSATCREFPCFAMWCFSCVLLIVVNTQTLHLKIKRSACSGWTFKMWDWKENNQNLLNMNDTNCGIWSHSETVALYTVVLAELTLVLPLPAVHKWMSTSTVPVRCFVGTYIAPYQFSLWLLGSIFLS